ncbi:hypothetical protein CDL15_Pgr018775 [Punica granatum]|uniref:Uncharacterized protein n=1 Tax=Punica granatum TaxID=22663 RepID=A0A218VUH9_PUNGR|nr:hypothetical protein CDL15_Pgr018775 [Punica granatum]
MDQVGSDRIGSPARRRNRPEELLDRTEALGRTSGLDLRDKEMGRGPLARSGPNQGSGGGEAVGGGSRPWTPRRRHERAREMALGIAWTTRCPIWTLPVSKRPESRGKVAFSGEGFRNLRS